jgi:hypothetical protein
MQEENENLGGRAPLGDKIFGAHNNPTDENSYRENFELDHQHKFLESSYDEEEYIHRKKLEEAVFSAFQASRWYPLSYKKKIPKDLIPHLFQDVLEKLEESEFGFSEKFVVICDFIEIQYIKAYEMVPGKYKEIIVSELEAKYGILSRKKIKRLF